MIAIIVWFYKLKEIVLKVYVQNNLDKPILFKSFKLSNSLKHISTLHSWYTPPTYFLYIFVALSVNIFLLDVLICGLVMYKVHRYEWVYHIIFFIWVTAHHRSTMFKAKCTYATVTRPLCILPSWLVGLGVLQYWSIILLLLYSVNAPGR